MIRHARWMIAVPILLWMTPSGPAFSQPKLPGSTTGIKNSTSGGIAQPSHPLFPGKTGLAPGTTGGAAQIPSGGSGNNGGGNGTGQLGGGGNGTGHR